MRRSLPVITTVLNGRSVKMFSSDEKWNLINNFKDWKLHASPSYLELPINDDPEYNIPKAVNNYIFSKVPTEPLPGAIRLVCSSDAAMSDILDLDPKVAETEEFIDFVAGKTVLEGGFTVCHRYGGYQFGYWADQLGDGRAHILGEYVNSKSQTWQLQLKGSGETPYSRFGDGRAVLRSSIREMVASEACYFLGIPTTRAAALVASDEPTVWRDKHYCGRAKKERAAVVLRLSNCWFRFGSLEILNIRKEYELLETLLDYIIRVHFPEISEGSKYVKWFDVVAHTNLDMVASWQGFGFTHGVLNTDNMSLQGLTIDYGPYGFMDYYNDHFVPNTSDDMGRYSYARQPEIVLWNITQLYKAIEPILTEDDKEKIDAIIRGLRSYVDNKILNIFRSKLGLKLSEMDDVILVNDFKEVMRNSMADFTASFRQLSEIDPKDLLNKEVLKEKWSLSKLSEDKNWNRWVESYRQRIVRDGNDPSERRRLMLSVNPIYIPRNYILEEAIRDAENNEFEKVQFLMKILQRPFDKDAEAETRGYSSQPPSWAFGIKLSCSS